MEQKRYVVQKGDTLWDLADEHLGSPLQWHRIYAHNNRASVSQVTGSRIKDPDQIYPGQTLLIPLLPNQPKLPRKRDPKRVRPKKLKEQVNKTYSPFATAYKLDDLPVLTYENLGVPAFKATIRFSGDVAIRLADKIPLAYVTNQGLEMTFKRQTNNILDRLLAETQLEWDKSSNQIRYACMMVTNSSTNNGPSTAIGISVSSNKPVPVLRGEFRYPELKGHLDGNFYCATNVKVIVEIEPKSPNIVRRPDIDLERDLQYTRETRKIEIHWQPIAAGITFIGITIITDFLTGVGVADDAVTIPYALRLIASGIIIHSVAAPRNAIASEQLGCVKSH